MLSQQNTSKTLIQKIRTNIYMLLVSIKLNTTKKASKLTVKKEWSENKTLEYIS